MQIPVDTYGDVVMKKVLVRSGFMLKIINIDRMCQRVHDPIFADTGRAVFKKFYAVITLRVRRGGYLDNPVRGTVAAYIVQLALIANNADVRFNVIPAVFVLKYCKRGRIDFAVLS